MNKLEAKNTLISELKKVCDSVESFFDHPEQRAEAQMNFPYITTVWREWKPVDGALYGLQSVDLIGIVQGDDDCLEQRSDTLCDKVVTALYKNDNLKCTIKNINNSNLFEPFGINAGVYPPFAGFRIELDIPNIRLT